mgnify:FL=1
MATLTCDIVTPTKRLFTEECHMVVAPGVEGTMGIMAGHAQVMTTLADGGIRVFSDANTVAASFAAMGGYMQVTPEKVIILADHAVPVEAIDAAAVQKEIADAEESLKKAEGSEKQLAERNLNWAKVRARVVGSETA